MCQRNSACAQLVHRIEKERTPAGQFEIAPAKESVRTLKGFGATSGRKLSVEQMNQVIAQRRAAK